MVNYIVSYICHINNTNIVTSFVKDLFIGIPHILKNIDDIPLIEEKKTLIGNSILVITDGSFNLAESIILDCSYQNIIVLHNNTCSNPDPKTSNIYYLNITDGIMCGEIRIKFLKDNNFFSSIDENIPYVSCICPTYNRHKFIPLLCKLFNDQDYPKELCELIILDDSDAVFTDIDKYNINGNIRYYYIEAKKSLPIGKKRNLLHQLVRGKYVVCFDDDDYYPPNRISHCIETLRISKKKIAGSSKLFIYYSDIKKIYGFGPYSKTHATNGTLGYHYTIIFDHYYDDNGILGEEKKFLNNFRLDMVQLDSIKTILCIAHKSNTFDKNNILQFGDETQYILKDFVKNNDIMNIYKILFD